MSVQILVVDDDASIRGLLRVALRRCGYDVVEAVNGREALDVMRGMPPALVVLDLMMPEVTGWEVLRVRGDDETLSTIPIILASAATGSEVGAAVASGVCAFLPKPFEITLLESIVASCLTHPHGRAAAANHGV